MGEDQEGRGVTANRTILVDLFWKVKKIWEATGVVNTQRDASKVSSRTAASRIVLEDSQI